MANKYDSEQTKKQILSSCVKLFIEKGYTNTTMAEILKNAGVSAGSFHSIFRTKDGILMDLTRFMFSNQFGTAEFILGENPDPVTLYALETAIQLAISELNENLRDIYVEAYTYPETLAYINEMTARELPKVFGRYLPDSSEADFYEMELGTGGMMRSFMARKCDVYFTLDRKIERFLTMVFLVMGIPEEKRKAVIGTILGMDICAIANNVIQKLFAALAMKYEFTLTERQADGKE